ncbi:MerR family transcriptional regulator [Scardovia wiggsiae]|uniref:MerR family transcriptional regulator n=1 Tax=Scardovia wiggsiae TaxID=230143 RepID=UPI00374F0F84
MAEHNKPQLSLHIRLEDRKDLSGKDAVQGELFESTDRQEDLKGYKGPVAAEVAGITYRQLDYWARKKIVEPSITPSHGSGSRRLYSFRDVVILSVSKHLLDAGVNLQNVNKAITFLMAYSLTDLEHMMIVCDGESVMQCTDNHQMLDVMSSGQAVFGVSVAAIWHKVENDLSAQDYVDMRNTGVRVHSQSVIDELAELRQRKRIEAQRAQREYQRAQGL